jgi:hypothetical protein
MRTPKVTELPMRLQPTHHDPFIDRLAVVPGSVAVVRPTPRGEARR